MRNCINTTEIYFVVLRRENLFLSFGQPTNNRLTQIRGTHPKVQLKQPEGNKAH